MNVAVDTERNESMIAAVLDVRKLARRCRELSCELATRDQVIDEQNDVIAELRSEMDKQSALSLIGENELQRQKEKIRSCIRAIVHHTGERERLQQMETLLADETVPPEEINRLYAHVNREFEILYPNQPASCLTNESTTIPKERDWTRFRMG